MATVNYLVVGKKNFSNILLRFKNGRKADYTISTDLKVEPKHWSKAKQKIKNIAGEKTKDEINNHLVNLKKFVIDEFNLDNASGVFINREWLKKKIAKYFNRPSDEAALDQIYFVPYVENFIKLAPTRLIKGKNKPVSKGTITKYTTTKNKLKEYEEKFKTKIKFTDLDLLFYDKFVDFLSREQNINYNTIGNYIGTIKTIARDAKLKDLPVHPHIEHPKFFAPKSKSISIYLNKDEIDQIYKHDFSDSVSLDNARDLFIIGLHTGLRISDFLRLKESNIKEGFFEIKTQKTGQHVVIPMHQHVKAILKKHNGFPRKISDQKFNKHIKTVCEKVGLKQKVKGSKINPKTKRKEIDMYPKYDLVTSHICRRSFATNLYGELPNMVIMGVTGHQTETQFLKYIKITPKENAERLKAYWKNEEQKKQAEDVVLKKVN